jgi:site-specific DNA-methyltransferase (adenine-specific)
VTFSVDEAMPEFLNRYGKSGRSSVSKGLSGHVKQKERISRVGQRLDFDWRGGTLDASINRTSRLGAAMNTLHRVVIGDSRDMAEVADGSVHLVITSPPYWQLKDYGKDGQIGFNDSYEEYIDHLNLVWKECHRALVPGCRLCINIGDQFARSVYYGRYKVIPIRTEIIRFCETLGFDYMGAVIWQKVTTCNTSGGATVMGSYPFPRNGVLKIDYEFILLFKKHGKAPKVDRAVKEAARLTVEEWNEYFSGHWNFSGERQGDKRLAAFPEELPRRLIRMFSFPGETVLDPFLGTGTTSLAASKLGRRSVGYEINEDFLPLIRERLEGEQHACSGASKHEVVRAHACKLDLARSLEELPYRFRDPLLVERKMDPRKKRFGSRVDARSARPREDYYRVKSVRSPSLLVLDDGTAIRLLGIKEKKGSKRSAIGFLREKTRGHRVYMKFDAPEKDEEGNPYCYLYLENRTFVNKHLLRTGFVEADRELDHRLKKQFIAAAEYNRHAEGDA